MATSNRDIKLTVEAQALGVDSIKNLAAQVRALGKDGGDAAPEFQRLAAQLDQIADQSKAVLGLKQLAAEVENLGVAQANAAKIAEGTASAYQAQQAATNALRDTLVKSTDDWNTARRAQIAAREALDAAKRETEALTAKEKARNSALQEAKQNLSEATAEQRRLKVAVDEASDALAKAAKLEREVGAEYRKTANALTGAETALRGRSEALKDAQGAAQALGVETADLAAAEAALRGALVTTAQAAEQQQQALRTLADLDEQAAAAAGRLAAANERAARTFYDGVAAQERLDAEQRQSAASALEFVLAEERAAAAAREVAAELDAVAAAFRKQQNAAEYTRFWTQELDRLDREAKETAESLRSVTEAAAKSAKAAEEVDRLADAAARMNRAAEYTRFWADELDRLDREAQQAAAAATELKAATTAAGAALGKAFDTVGVRSVQAIQTEIAETTRAMALLQQRFQAGEVTAYDLARATGAAQARMQALSAEMAKMPAAAGVFERMNTATLDLATRFGAIAAAMATVGYAAKPILDANLALDSMRRVLTTVYGSAEAAAEQIDFVRKVADESGLSVLTLGESFTRFAASAKASGIDAGLVRDVFQATAAAAGNLGLSTDKTTHILDALGQMANKGTVSMEELRQQLGDSLPGALSLLAKGLGITEPQLVKLVESGKLLTTEALGPLAQAMTTLAAPDGRVEGLRAALSRLGNEFTLAYQKISDTSFYRGLTVVVGGLADNFNAVTTAVKLMVEALVVSKIATAVSNFIGLRQATSSVAAATAAATEATVANTAATAVNTTATAANTAAKTANVAASAAAGTAAVAVTGAISTLGTAAAGAAASVGTLARAKATLGAASGRLVTALGGPIGAVATLGIALYELGPALVRGAAALAGYGDKTAQVKAQIDAAAEAVRAGHAAREAEAGGLVRAKVLYAEQAATLSNATSIAERLAKATKDQGEAAMLAAEQSGNERAKLLATTTAREADAAALDRVAAAKRAEADLTAGLLAQTEKSIEGRGRLNAVDQQRLDTLLATRDSLGQLSKAQAEELAALQTRQDAAEKLVASTREQIKADREKLEGQRAASAEAEAAAEKERALADAARFAAEAARDQTGRIRELEQQYRTASESVDLMRQALARGETTQGAVNRAVREAAQAQGLYRVAVEQAAKVGVDFRQIQTGVSESFFKSTEALHGTITSLTNYKVGAADASPVLEEAFNKATTVAKTTKELEFLRAEVERAQQAGLLFGTTYADALDKIKQKAAEVNPVMRQLQAEAKRLGVELAGVTGSKPSASPTYKPNVLGAMDNQQRGPLPPGVTQQEVDADPYGRSADQIAALKRQGGPVDNSYVFGLRERLRNGEQFGANELPAIQAALAAAESNARLSSSAGSLAGARDAEGWVMTLRQVLARAGGQALGSTGGATGAGSLGSGAAPAGAAAPQAMPSVNTGGVRTLRLDLGGGRNLDYAAGSTDEASRVEALLQRLAAEGMRAGG